MFNTVKDCYTDDLENQTIDSIYTKCRRICAERQFSESRAIVTSGAQAAAAKSSAFIEYCANAMKSSPWCEWGRRRPIRDCDAGQRDAW